MKDQPEWLKTYLTGLADPKKWSVLIDGIGYAIIRRPGVMYWNGHMNNYAPASQWLVTKGINYWDEHGLEQWEGRITNAKRALMAKALEAREAT